MIAFFDVGADMSKLQTNDLNSIQEFTKNQLMADFDVLFDTANLPNPLNEASRYAISNGGKRVRPLLVLATFLAAGGCVDTPVFGAVRRAMLAIEMIHSYSLVHDDLPCMDDDDLRRGKPTCHVVYGEATAMLVGDVLQSLAFDVLGGDYWGDTDDVKFAKLTKILASNARRMVAGQQADLNGEQKQLNQNELEAIHKDKTGALIVASVLMGAVCGGTSDERMASLGEYARLIGLAYQVQDDVLDVVADTQTLGKMAGSDEKLDKSTYVKLLGVDNARAYADELFDKAREQVADLGDDNLLLQMVDWLQKRDH
ncbi:polyprenyl synthetase family protein [Moraxella bovis]|uniref:Polyprenyl synthetase family protein n=2 Tax=Moraxella bovis TaxID=476 RepID=A0AAQ2Q9S5_MORBO|nr:farnesyl diphosphate synthase [Moraxella bovis]AWY19351.1 polyprenyl synthetase family protein [Moraxella bovis]UYZ76057.1 polyprenyl synthetase family protein [Moraxella bovis]UYZ77990.1 polyprenyl synthetase family protein [Moraxella bovis]UYZ86476.1 polyprenyl synthetase family protein [Moraxella bovis]UYZ89825.1 polyprenyl synthetase family protein [Moraxella bovis]